MKRHTLRASSGSYFRPASAQRLEDVIQALTNESIEESLDEIEIAFLQRFGTKQGPTRDRKKLTAD